jgi:hypothetical protein
MIAKGCLMKEHDACKIQTILQECSRPLPKCNVDSTPSSLILSLDRVFFE